MVKAAWMNNLPDLLTNLPPKPELNKLTSSEHKHLASVVKKSNNEHAFCALFTAAARGNLEICKAVLEAGKNNFYCIRSYIQTFPVIKRFHLFCLMF